MVGQSGRGTTMSIIEINVTLEYIEPTVTRTLQVPIDIRLDRLHLTLQAAMGWTNSHLYMFQAGGATWGIPDPDFGGDDLPPTKQLSRRCSKTPARPASATSTTSAIVGNTSCKSGKSPTPSPAISTPA